MEILRQYNDDTLELISSGSYEFTSFGEIYVDSYFDLKNNWSDGVISNNSYWQDRGVTDKESFGKIHYELAGKDAERGFPKIKLSVFDDIGSFQDSEDLQEGNDFYVRDNQIFLKPNEYLDRTGFSEGNYNLQFDFITRFKENNELYISEISPSRKEIRIQVNEQIYVDGFDDNYVNQIIGFLNGGDNEETYQFNSFLELSQGRLIPINGYALDRITNDKNTFILKLNEPLPNGISTLTNNFNISNKFLSSQNESIFFIDREGLAVSGLGLTIDEGYLNESNFISSSYQNYNEISSSSGLNIIDTLSKLKKDVNLNINYNKFDNHVFFGSAKSKLENFKTKVVRLDGLLSQISSSLSLTNNSSVISKRKNLFEEIRTIENNFTHFEHFMYNDGQSYSTSSAPGIGQNLAGNNFDNNYGKTIPLSSSMQVEGFDSVYHFKSNLSSTLHMFTDIYNVEDAPFYNTNDFIYLSFLLSGERTGNATYNFSSDASGSNTEYDNIFEGYRYGKDRKIPSNAFSGSSILNPPATGSEYKRYIFKAQQNYFRPISGVDVADINFANNSGDFEILSGSNVLSASLKGNDFCYGIRDSSGNHIPYFFPSQYDPEGLGLGHTTDVFASILPQGDLFPIRINDAGNYETFVTDIKVSKVNPKNIHPFSNIYRPPSGSYAGSSEWNDWYTIMETIAENYDTNNINSLMNNLPEFLRSGDEHQIFRDFVNMLGEQFDLLRSYIDNYHNIYKLGYKNPNSMPDNLLPIIGNSLGFDLNNPLSGSLENYLESTKGDEVGDKKAIASLWTKILNNIIYIYKTKGTQEGINTLLNLYGYDTTSFNLTEYGGSTSEHNPSVVTNNAINDLDNGLNKITGNVSFLEKLEPLRSLNLSSGSSFIALDWYSNDAEPNGLEFIFRSTAKTQTQTLVRSSGSNDNWDLRIVPSGSSTTTGSLQLRINNTEHAGSAISNNAISMSTDYINNINNAKYFNVMLQRNVVTASNNVTQSYHVFIGRKEGDKIQDIQHISMSSESPFVNQNFTTASGQTSNNLLFGEVITGSLSQIRAWDSYISMSKFKQHILNYNSVVGASITSARDNLVYHYKLSENVNSTVLKDISSKNKVKSFDKTISEQPSLHIKSNISNVKNYRFQVRGTDAIKSKKQTSLGSNLKAIGNLNSENSVLKTPFVDGTDTTERLNINKIGKTFSYVDAIDSLIFDVMSDFVLDDYLDDGVNDGVYNDLLTLRKQIITEKDVKTDIDKNLSAVEKYVDDGNFIKNVESAIPAKTKLEFNYEIKNDILFRSKTKKAKLQTELNPNKVIGATNLTEPTVGFNFNENKYEKTINVKDDEFSVSGFSNENVKEQTINILTDVGVTSNANNNLKTNESIPLNISDLSDSSNQNIFNITLNNFTDLLLGKKNEFFKNHGKNENKTFFKSANPGSDGNYNTSRYEDRFFFRTVGDIEEFFPISGTFDTRVGANAKQPFNHHDNFRHFGNRYYVDSGSGYTYNSFFGSDDATVDGRMVGRTLFFKTDTDGNITYPINHYFKVGTSKDVLNNLIYKGTQYDGSGPKYFDPELDTSPSIPAYTINVGGSDTTKKLKVIR